MQIGTTTREARIGRLHWGLALLWALCGCAPTQTETAVGDSPAAWWPETRGERFAPAWGQAVPEAVLGLAHDVRLSDERNGAVLTARIAALQPGQMLEIGRGTWSLGERNRIALEGTAERPIWIVAKPGETPVLTRPDDRQNVLNLGLGGAARFLCLRGLEIQGGSEGIKLYDCANLWIDACHVHHTGSSAISANAADTSQLTLTRNRIHHTAGTGEGLYLGANHGERIMSRSVVARNHVYATGGTQGDGIEVKQGSFDNWIVENLVHDTPFPCILVYGTGGQLPNRIEGNICYNSADNVLQVQGEAIVRNNLLIHGKRAFASEDHQGSSRDLIFVHNTLINTSLAAELRDWGGRVGMVFANNAVYSRRDAAVRFTRGSRGVVLCGNVALGAVVGAASGFEPGLGLNDFRDVTFGRVEGGGPGIDARPSPHGALIGAPAAAWTVAEDLTGAARTDPPESGCYDLPPTPAR
jgi:hypothetical protein